MASEAQALDVKDELKNLLLLLGNRLPGLAEMLNAQDLIFAEGSLSGKMKHLIAIALAVSDRCDGTIGYHVEKALLAGATRQEILEAVSVAVFINGPSCMFSGAEALALVTQFEAVGN